MRNRHRDELGAQRRLTAAGALPGSRSLTGATSGIIRGWLHGVCVLEESRRVGRHRLCTAPGGWMHFSEVKIDVFRALDPSRKVDFEWQKPTGQVEGFIFVAAQVRPVRADRRS
jgi:hypothetical protein